MAGMTDTLENALINQVLRQIPYTAPTTLYLALLTTDPTDTGMQTSEVSGNAYVREPITFNAPVAGTTTNVYDITFPVATGNWGTIAYVGVCDALTAGNILFSGLLSVSQAVILNNQLVFKAGQITITLD